MRFLVVLARHGVFIIRFTLGSTGRSLNCKLKSVFLKLHRLMKSLLVVSTTSNFEEMGASLPSFLGIALQPLLCGILSGGFLSIVDVLTLPDTFVKDHRCFYLSSHWRSVTAMLTLVF